MLTREQIEEDHRTFVKQLPLGLIMAAERMLQRHIAHDAEQRAEIERLMKINLELEEKLHVYRTVYGGEL